MEFWIILCIVFFVGGLSLASYLWGAKEWRQKWIVSELNAEAMKRNKDRQIRELDERLQHLTMTFDRQVEQEAEKRIRSWTPTWEMIKEDFALAEKVTEAMAKKREQLDAGRPHPPRDDQKGSPARVGRIKVSKGLRRPLT